MPSTHDICKDESLWYGVFDSSEVVKTMRDRWAARYVEKLDLLTSQNQVRESCGVNCTCKISIPGLEAMITDSGVAVPEQTNSFLAKASQGLSTEQKNVRFTAVKQKL